MGRPERLCRQRKGLWSIMDTFGEPDSTGFGQQDGFGDQYYTGAQAATEYGAGFGDASTGFGDGGEFDATSAYMTPTTTADDQSRDQFYGGNALISEVPTPGYFAPDGTYVPPSGMPKAEESSVDDSILRKWEDEQKALIQSKDEEERAAVSEREAASRKELEEFAAAREKRIQVTNQNNLTAEQAFIADRDAQVDASNLWDRVTHLVDVSKAKKDQNEKEGVVDMSRFRSLLLQLKHTPV
eukprot:c14968_g1_i1.p1 GENE.c14968_g1_i1~~c14968_g1_i1.p1  ORF type:complete len:241 (+),score=65.30 c14968_g1_i1:1-723(+)